LSYVAEYLARFGCSEIVVNLHHRPESVRNALGTAVSSGVNLTYVEGEKSSGPAALFDNARELLDQDTLW
jgi:NDP-sugar pyrophosphorylase family protein